MEENKKNSDFKTAEIDPLLTGIALNANNNNGNFKIIIQVNGAFGAGTVISALEYFNTAAEENKTGKFKEYLSDQDQDMIKETDAVPVYIHFKEISFHSSSMDRGIVMPLWRAKIKDISGFTYGSFNEQE